MLPQNAQSAEKSVEIATAIHPTALRAREGTTSPSSPVLSSDARSNPVRWSRHL